MPPAQMWLDGILSLFLTPVPKAISNAGPVQQFGFATGRQIVGLYLIEMLLKYALDDRGVGYKKNHNLQELFRKLSCEQRRAVEKKYSEILGTPPEWARDIAKTPSSLLRYLGDNPITDTRYFGEPKKQHKGAIRTPMQSKQLYRPLIYALLIELQDCPADILTEGH